MSDALFTITDFLDPVNRFELSMDNGYKNGQIGTVIHVYEEEFPDVTPAHIVFVGCGEERGRGGNQFTNANPDAIRNQLYNLFYWHKDLILADIGNIKPGATIKDTYAALRAVVSELIALGKTVVILGGSHDLTIAQYEAYRHAQTFIELICIDALIDLGLDRSTANENFLMHILTDEPNYIRHYNHIGFQSYLVHPDMLETMDKLRFDCFRVGHVRQSIEEMEPVFRNAQMLSIDISAMQHAAAIANSISPNGFTGEEMCTLTKFAGMNPQLNTIGIFGYQADQDIHDLSAKQIAQMIWYFIDGRNKGIKEANFSDTEAFHSYHTRFNEEDCIFLQSKKSGRWWMQIVDNQYTACSYQDYICACNRDIPERWLRIHERKFS